RVDPPPLDEAGRDTHLRGGSRPAGLDVPPGPAIRARVEAAEAFAPDRSDPWRNAWTGSPAGEGLGPPDAGSRPCPAPLNPGSAIPWTLTGLETWHAWLRRLTGRWRGRQ